MFETRNRGLSSRYSLAAGSDEIGLLQDDDAHLRVMFPKSVRCAKIRSQLIWLFVVIFGLLYLLVILILYNGELDNPCTGNLILWIGVYFLIHSLHLVRTVANMLIWGYAKDPVITSTKMEIFFGVWIFIFEIGWTIYGNFIVYNNRLYEVCP